MTDTTPFALLSPAQTTAVAGRVLRQLAHDRRFLALSLVMPVAVIIMIWVFFDAVDNPFFDVMAFIPPVSGYIVHFLTYVLSAIVLVRERTAGTLPRMFVGGYRRGSIIAGYVLAYTALGAVQTFIVIAMTNLLFDLGYDLATWLFLYLVFWLLALTSISLGILVSNFARNEGQVLPFIPLVLIWSVFLSGMIVSVDRLPGWIAWLHVVTPMYYATEAINAIVSGDIAAGATANTLWLLLYGAVVLLLAVLTLRPGD